MVSLRKNDDVYSTLISRGYDRKKCVRCGSFFWTCDAERLTCGDPPCDPYGFIRHPPVEQAKSFREVRKLFISFFSDSHTVVNPYPVVPRWRDDVLLVNASIYAFQPHVTSGIADPPGNPLVMSQPSIRMIDEPNVGKTGRHLTSFEMMCHDAFNIRGRDVYWKNETIEYCHRFFTEALGIDKKLITYKEKPWSGGGNGGDALEVFILGLEVATLVFMDLRESTDGDIVIDGVRYSKMDNRIVDTGYGLERIAWLTDGKPSIYDSLYPEIMSLVSSKVDGQFLNNEEVSFLTEFSSKHEGVSERSLINAMVKHFTSGGREKESLILRYRNYKNAAVIADHTRTILLLLNDKVVPSNVKVGYILRLLIRKVLQSIKMLGINVDIEDFIKIQRNKFSELVPQYDESFSSEILSREIKKYERILKEGIRMVRRTISSKGKLTRQDVVRMYESNGLDPEIVAQVYEEETGEQLELPDDIRTEVSGKRERKTTIEKINVPDIETRPLYYDDPMMREFSALVLYSNGEDVILNQTCFYPEGGGQPSDTGYLFLGKNKWRVDGVKKQGKTIIHHIAPGQGVPPEKIRVRGTIDWDRRWRLMIHHTATHLLMGVLKEVLGSHVWQTGVQKGTDLTRLDIVHYKEITEEEKRKIESRCLELIEEDKKVKVRNLPWKAALERYGFTLFQGGVPRSGQIRVVEIEDVDIEGCGGTHLKSISPIGMIKILGIENLQENILRIKFSAGPALLEHIQSLQATVDRIRQDLKIEFADLEKSVKKLLHENRAMRKSLSDRLKRDVQNEVERYSTVIVGDHKIAWISTNLNDEGIKLLLKASASLGFDLLVIKNVSDNTVSIVSKGDINAGEFFDRINREGTSPVSRGRNFARGNYTGEITEKLIKDALD